MTGPEAREQAAEERDRPFGRFRLETEAMADGRRIHYYSWPAEGGSEAAPEAGAHGRPVDRSADADE
jgi:hypothetical protein